MDRDKTKEEIRERWEEILAQITDPAKTKANGKTSYICPLCGHGKNGDGLTFNPQSKDGKGLKCFGCNFSGDIIDLIGEVENIADYPEKLKRAGEYIGINTDGQSTEKTPRSASLDKHTHMDIHTDTYTYKQEEKSLLPYYRKCQQCLRETGYLLKRGISEEVATRFMLGFDPTFSTKDRDTDQYTQWGALIIPTGHSSYVARNTDPQATDKNRYRDRGRKSPFNWKALQNATKPIFVVEGEIDALSIIEAGGEAIGLGGVGIDSFIRDYMEKHPPVQPLVVALDNDDAGQEATQKLEEKLREMGVTFYRLNPAGDFKDANEALLADRETFALAVAQAEKIEEEALEAEREAYLSTSTASHLQEFINGIAESVNTPAQITGFPNLDKVLDGGLFAGLYFIGAISSLGKTTLALQIADQIADSGRDVLIFSLEMARSELMSKSISRLTLLDVLANGGDTADAKTNRGITVGARYEHYSKTEREIIQRSITAYGKYAQHIYIHEGIGDIGTAEVRRTIEKHEKLAGKTPVVLIDYVQILAQPETNKSLTDKQVVDKNVLELKRISRDHKTPIICISSFNRDNYYAPVNLASFKESGAIEYSSDVLIGLQYEGMDYRDEEKDKDRQKRIRKLLKDMEERGKNGESQTIQLKILKNRNGGKGEVFFDYYPVFNYFKEK